MAMLQFSEGEGPPDVTSPKIQKDIYTLIVYMYVYRYKNEKVWQR